MVLSTKANSPARKALLEKQRCLGDFHHNKNVEETGEGEIIVVRRPGQNNRAEPFVPCVHCFGYMIFHANSTQKPRKIGEDDNRLSMTLASMRNDEVTAVVKRDDVIKKVGLLLLGSHGTKQSHHVSQKMRACAPSPIPILETKFRKKALLPQPYPYQTGC